MDNNVVPTDIEPENYTWRKPSRLRTSPSAAVGATSVPEAPDVRETVWPRSPAKADIPPTPQTKGLPKSLLWSLAAAGGLTAMSVLWANKRRASRRAYANVA